METPWWEMKIIFKKEYRETFVARIYHLV